MDAWEEFWHQIGLLATAFLGIFLAFVGDLVRLFHEQERGGTKVGLRALPGSIVRSILMGVIATATAGYLRDKFGLPELIGGALGGILGYLGPSIIGVGFKSLIEWYLPKKPQGPENGP